MNNKTKVVSIILFLSLIIMLASCKPQKAEWKGTIEEENGVTVVKNPKEPMYEEDVCSIEEDEEGYQYVKRYKVSWKY